MNKKFFILIPVFLILSTWIGVEVLFHTKQLKTFEFGSRTWIHRQNTLKELSAAVTAGYEGIECDIFYIKEEDNFIVAHDLPLIGEKVYLEDFFIALKDSKVRLWLDLKNSASLDHVLVAEKLSGFANKYNFRNRYFVEAPNILHQTLLSLKGIDTVLWISGHKRSRIAFLRDFAIRLAIVVGDFVALSFPYPTFEDVGETYENFPKLLFTVNDSSLIEKYEKNKNIKVILQDI